MDLNEFLTDDRVAWTKWRKIKYKGQDYDKPQLIALMKGDVPERVFVPCIGYRKIAVYKDIPVLCFKCSKWGHMAYRCQNRYRCQYCGRYHDSKECAKKIEDNIKIVPKCCNCGEGHNASSWSCKKRPTVVNHQAPNVSGVNNPAAVNDRTRGPLVNVWEQRNKEMQRGRENAVGGMNILIMLVWLLM